MVRPVIVAVAVLGFAAVDAHTNMAVPVVKWPDNFYNGNSFMGRIPSTSLKVDSSLYGTPKVDKVMESYKTLRQMVMTNMELVPINGLTGNKQCGLTITTGEKQPLPDAIDFPWGHPGPCEVWCDNTRIFYNNECQGNNVGKVKVDKAKCAGASIIQAMYVGTHVANWEVYMNCAPIVGGTKTDPATLFKSDADGSGAAGGASSGGDSAASDATTKPATTPSTAPATPPAAGGSDDDDGTPAVTPAPAATTKTPTVTTKAPTPAAPSPASTKACKRRVRH